MKTLLLALLCALSFNSLAQEKTINRQEQQQKLAEVQAEIALLSEKIDRVQLRLNQLPPEEIPVTVTDELQLMRDQLLTKQRAEFSIRAYLESTEEAENANDNE